MLKVMFTLMILLVPDIKAGDTSKARYHTYSDSHTSGHRQTGYTHL
jgi:hypothetical protein